MKMLGIILIVVAIVWAVALLPIIFLGASYPTAGLVGPVLCGAGNQLSVTIEIDENASRLRGSLLGTAACVNEAGEVTNDSLIGTLLIVSMVPAVILGAIGGALLNLGNMYGGLGAMKESAAIAKIPEVKAQLEALAEDYKAGRLSYEDCLAMSRNIIENYKARQQAAS